MRSPITASEPSNASSMVLQTVHFILSIPRGSIVGGANTLTFAPIVVKLSILLRATRLCLMSPMIATVSPSTLPKRSTIVNRSRSACVGCACRPSPALTTGMSTLSATNCGAPETEWRMTIASVPIASMVFAVSISDSPFCTLEVATSRLATVAPKYLHASSNEVRVRVLFS